MIASQLVMPAGHRLRPVDLGAIAACGHATVRVSRRPQVAIIPLAVSLSRLDSQSNQEKSSNLIPSYWLGSQRWGV